jgi:hypothetical protein
MRNKRLRTGGLLRPTPSYAAPRLPREGLKAYACPHPATLLENVRITRKIG